MRTKPFLIALLTSAAGLSCGFSQTTWGAAGNASIALTLTEAVGGLYQKDGSGQVIEEEWVDEETGKTYKQKIPTFENTYTLVTEKGPIDERYTAKEVSVQEGAAKMLTYRYGNAEILRELLENGDLGDETTSISGWSIVAVYDAINDEIDRSPQFYARNTAAKIMIPIEGINLDEEEVVPAYTNKTTESTSYNRDGDTTAYSYSRSHTGTWKGRAQVDINGILGTGLISGGERLTAKRELVYEDEETGDKEYETYYFYLPSALTVDGIVGIDAGEFSNLLIQGKVSIAQSTLTDLDAYLFNN